MRASVRRAGPAASPASEGTSSGIVDLRFSADPALLAAFVRLYDDCFTEPSERDDPAAWPERLWEPGSPDLPEMHLLVAPGDPGLTAGGLLFEYYPRSRCGLLGYLAVAPEHRRRGLARQLVTAAVDTLEDVASARGRSLAAVFAECEDPTLFQQGRSAIDPRDRLAAMARLGGLWVDLPYVQPDLCGGGRAHHLLLVAFQAPVLPSLTREVVRDFLREYYGALGVTDVDNDPDWGRMDEHLRSGLRLRELAER